MEFGGNIDSCLKNKTNIFISFEHIVKQEKLMRRREIGLLMVSLAKYLEY